MRIVISSAVKVFYEENDNVFFGNLNNFFAFMEQRTKEYNKITKTEFNSILKSRAQKAVAFPIGYARKIMIDIKNKSNDFFKSITILKPSLSDSSLTSKIPSIFLLKRISSIFLTNSALLTS